MARNFQKATGKIWSPSKDSEGNPKNEPSENDYIMGAYRGYTTKELKYGDTRVHHILAEEVDGQKVSDDSIYDVIGNSIIDDDLEGVLHGVTVYIKWLGKRPPKNNPQGNPYNVYDVYFDQDEQDRLMKERSQGSAFQGAESSGGSDKDQSAEQAPQQEQSSGQDESDDLPF
jgi:hypothetical protein